jgi:plastocyanin
MFRRLCPLAFALVLVAGCEEKKSEAPAAPAAPAANAPAAANPPAAPAPAAPAATPPGLGPAAGGGKGDVKGVVTLSGKAPEMPELKRGSDPFCAKTPMKDEEVVAKDGKLKNVLVHIVGAPATEPPTTPVTLVQDNCMYRPRVLGLVAGQTLSIKNADNALHNVHTYKGTTTVFNVAQVPNAPDIEKKFTDAGALLKLKCDVHQWMTGYVWVQNNPYFAVTGDDGKFEIKGVPAGKYEIIAWQERFGEKKGELTVNPDKTSEVKFDYTGTETAAK